MKRIFLVSLSWLLAVFLWGCSRSDWGHPSLPWAPTEHTEVIWVEADPDTRETTVPPEDLARQWAEQYIDVSQYEDNSKEGPRLDVPIQQIRVQGIPLSLGMGYEEVIDAGFLPQEDWADSETDGMIVTQVFTSPNGKSVTLEFWGPAGSILRNCTLRSVDLKQEDMDFHVEGIGERFTLDMILDVLGAPTDLRILGDRNAARVVLDYRFTGHTGCLQFMLDPEQDAIVRLHLWSAEN